MRLGGILLWGIMILSPHGALFCAFLDTINNFSGVLSSFPPVGASIAFMLVESAMYIAFVLYTDAQDVFQRNDRQVILTDLQLG